jgi:DNA-binding CsgD family transcriptional regulator
MEDAEGQSGHNEPGAPNRAVTKRDSSARHSTAKRDVALWGNWQSALYLFVLGWICLVLVPLTNLWWLALVCGMATPIALAALSGPGLTPRRPDDRKVRERELLDALAERGELTPTTAAMRTSLTVDEASKMLKGLTRKGHLELQGEGGIMAYALRERGRSELPGKISSAPPEEVSEGNGAPPWRETQQLVEPLSERELEVLELVASGRTNAEIAKDLFVAMGTVKSHTGNIYRKLDVKNRAEALGRARELKLLP